MALYPDDTGSELDEMKKRWKKKFWPENAIFEGIHPGDRIFVGTGCGEPQHLVGALKRFVEMRPNSLLGAEMIHVWTLGIAPCAEEKFRENFRLNSFFVGSRSRAAINRGDADYTPIFLSEVPALFRKGTIPIDVALIQTSPPDGHGLMSLGISVDIVKAAVEAARIVIAQINPQMPRIHGDGFISVDDVDYMVFCDEPLLEYQDPMSGEIAQRIGRYVARLVEDGSTIQVGYGSVPNAVLSNLAGKKHLGVHSELFTDGLADLMKSGVVDNSRKTVDRGKAVASFCMGMEDTYQFLDDNPLVEFRSIDYTNSPLIIAKNRGMTAINSCIEIDLSGQATAESLAGAHYSGIGGQADFMRGSVLARGGKSILALPSTADGGRASRIVPALRPGSGVTLSRGDVHYVVTEYGIAYLHAKNVRERAMDLISIAHPDHRPWLIEEAKRLNLIYPDQAFVPGEAGIYPENLEIRRTTKSGLSILLRPVKITDEPLLKEFFHLLSDESLYSRFMTARKELSHRWLQDFSVIDYSKKMVILAVEDGKGGRETIVGIGQYGITGETHMAEVAYVVRDDYHRRGVGREILSYLTYLAKKQGLLGFVAEVLSTNARIFRMFQKMGFTLEKVWEEDGVYEMRAHFGDVGEAGGNVEIEESERD
ncbi:MAG: Acetyl-CoA hydrolase/transferase [Methanothrix harundinacea]|uniref:Acetyl-CoA hydrolase/transferase n=1 Tax=Methanothrix harundinacea TaxID=301375 RepID=A0A101IHN1_9EURY|nr:MAG: Acetyl-CoA hydrolase/transferase [Methanothrix harundinacea]KUK95391.1 MAG: Acetyl-CoA hydrolase/transferase [Methanothrix harundinacea]